MTRHVPADLAHCRLPRVDVRVALDPRHHQSRRRQQQQHAEVHRQADVSGSDVGPLAGEKKIVVVVVLASEFGPFRQRTFDAFAAAAAGADDVRRGGGWGWGAWKSGSVGRWMYFQAGQGAPAGAKDRRQGQGGFENVCSGASARACACAPRAAAAALFNVRVCSRV